MATKNEILGTPAERAARMLKNSTEYLDALERTDGARSYETLLKIAADSREELRRPDVERVVLEAKRLGWEVPFGIWLLRGELKPETRAELLELTAELGLVIS